MTDRLVAPPIKDATEFILQLKPYEKMTLDNGVIVYAINAGVEDVLQLELIFYAGNSFEKQNSVAAAVSSLLKNGTSKKTAFEINEHFEYYGSYCNRAAYNETATVSLHTLNKHLPELLPVMREMITDASFPEDELEIYKKISKQRLMVNLKKSDFVASRMIDAKLYGENHPYGKFTRAEDLDALNTAVLKEFYQQYYVNGQVVIFAAGKLPADLFEQLNKNFGGLSIKPQPSTFSLPVRQAGFQPSTSEKQHLVNDPDGVQAAIRIARNFPNRHHPDFMKVMVLNSLFGGFFGSRLMSNIREDKGYTYGIHSFLQNHIEQSAWLISTEAGKDVATATVEEVYKEMLLLQEELVDEEELMLVKNYMMGSILGDLDGPFQIIGRWKNLILNDLDDAYFYRSIETIRNITAEELMELAKKYLVPADFHELVVI